MYTEEEIEYLKQNYNKFTNKELGEYLNKTNNSVERKLSRLGLKKGNKGSWSEEETEYLRQNYSKYTNKELSNYFKRSVNSILMKGGKMNLIKDSEYINRNNRIKKLSKYKYICKICNDFGTESLHGLSIHLSKLHKDIDQSNYYKNNIGNITKCHFCNEDGKFISLVDGYRNLCDSDICISKSRNTQTIDYLLKQGYTEGESILRLEELNNDRVLNGNITLENNLMENSDFTKEKSPNCKEFYIKRGHSEEDAIQIASDVVLNMQKISHKRRKDNPENYLHTYNTKIEYYLNHGYSEEESYSMLVDRQTTFSKEICVEKYGKVEGLKVWRDRQDKWLKTLDDKTDEEKLEINRKKMFNNSGYSMISVELFDNIYDRLTDIMKYKTYYSTNGGEFIRWDDIANRHYRFDFVNSLNKKVIEFNGDFWHCNPKKYDKDYYHRIWNKTAEEIWEYDMIKEKFIINKMRYDLLIIWEDDYKQNKEKTIQKCIKFLNNK